MGKYLNDYTVMCPFYKGHEDREICCEGIEDNGRIINEFPSKAKAKSYRDNMCACSWKKCIISTALNTKY